MTAPPPCVSIPSFPFRITPEEARSYRAALGLSGDAPLVGMAFRAATSRPVVDAIGEFAKGRYPIHVGQDSHALHPLDLDVDYRCEIDLVPIDGNRLRLEQRLKDQAGNICLQISSDIGFAERRSDDH